MKYNYATITDRQYYPNDFEGLLASDHPWATLENPKDFPPQIGDSTKSKVTYEMLFTSNHDIISIGSSFAWWM